MSNTTYSFPRDASLVIALSVARDILHDVINDKGRSFDQGVSAAEGGGLKAGHGEEFERDVQKLGKFLNDAVAAVALVDGLILYENNVAIEAGRRAAETIPGRIAKAAGIGARGEKAARGAVGGGTDDTLEELLDKVIGIGAARRNKKAN